MLSSDEAMAKLVEASAIITDSHIVLASGRHGSTYIDKDAVYPNTQTTSALCEALMEKVAAEILISDAATIIGPERGGIILSQWAAYHGSEMAGGRMMAVYAEKTGEKDGAGKDEFRIKPSWLKYVDERNLLVIEDVLTTGGSARKVVELVQMSGGRVLGVMALCNRGDVTAQDLGVPHLFSLVTTAQLSSLKLDTWLPDECPLCKAKVPINTDVGHGKEFLARQEVSRDATII